MVTICVLAFILVGTWANCYSTVVAFVVSIGYLLVIPLSLVTIFFDDII